MNIRFTRDYRGVLTRRPIVGEVFHVEGEEADYPEEAASAMIAQGVAEEVKPAAKTPSKPITKKKK